MEEHIDLAIATAIFLVFVGLCVGLCYHSTLAYALNALSSEIVAIAYFYPVKIPITYDASSKIATVGVGLKDVRAVIAVVKTSTATYQVKLFEERALPTKVSAEADEWVIALTPGGYGVKTGTAYPSGLVVTTTGVYPLTSAPSLYPRVKVTTTYVVEPSESMVVKTCSSFQTRSIDDKFLSELRFVSSKYVGPSDPNLKDYQGVVMLKEEYST